MNDSPDPAETPFAQRLVGNLPVAAAVLDRARRVLAWNDAFRSRLGVAEDAATGAAITDFLLRSTGRKARPSDFNPGIRRCYEIAGQEGLNSRLEASLTPLDPALAGFAGARDFLLMLIHESVAAVEAAGGGLEASERGYALAMRGAADGMWEWNPLTKDLYLSPRLLAILGYPESFAVRSTDDWLDLVHPEDRALYNAENSRHLRRETPYFQCEYRIRRADGDWAWGLSRGIAWFDEHGIARRMAGSITDISKRKHAESELRKAKAKLELAIEASAQVLWDADGDAGCFHFSEHLERLLGRAFAGTTVGLDAYLARCHADDRIQVGETFRRAFRGELPTLAIEHRIAHADGKWIWLKVQGQGVGDDGPTGRRLLGTLHDITERKQHEAHVQFLATRDALTRLPNRRLLDDELRQSLKAAALAGEEVLVVYLDLDNFKDINDTLGHDLGDRILVEIARRLCLELDEESAVGRQGGDEFILVARSGDEPIVLRRRLLRLLENLARPMQIDGQDLVVKASAGVAVYPRDGDSPALLLRRADIALYNAKANGRGQLAFFSADMETRVRERRSLELDLAKALPRNQLFIHYQPQVTMRGGGLTGCEALLRWRHPERGLVGPAGFVPLAESTRMIVPIGAWVLETACAQVAQWQRQGKPLTLAVNLSALQITSEGFLKTVRTVLARTGFDPRRLELEITESLLMEQGCGARNILETLAEMGITLAIDDFGTGYSSFAYLKQLPITRLKIDRSFVSDIDTDASKPALVRAMIAMARELNLDVIAEGIETAAERDTLLRLGCELGQGYLFGRPVAASDFAARLRETA